MEKLDVRLVSHVKKESAENFRKENHVQKTVTDILVTNTYMHASFPSGALFYLQNSVWLSAS